MIPDLGKNLRKAIAKIQDKPYVDEDDVKQLVKDLQRVLISGDVEVDVVLDLTDRVKERALEKDKAKGLSLKEHVLKIVYEELTSLLGKEYNPSIESKKILLSGLYGSGKTTTAAKLAHFYKGKGLSVRLVGADTDRPAAKEQLKQLAEEVGCKFSTSDGGPEKIVENALEEAKEDVIIVDSAGRNAFDEELAEELQRVAEKLDPDENYLIVPADVGQVAGKQARKFNEAVSISGVIVTKMDGSAKGGGALSSVANSSSQICFIGTGEKVRDLKAYDPEKFVGRLLGVPDMEGLLKRVEEVTKEDKEEMKKQLKEEGLTIETFYQQLKKARDMGPLSEIFSMMGAVDIPDEMVHQSEEKLDKYEAMINSMTKDEKKDAKKIRKSKSRMKRIARGSGCKIKEVRNFLSQFSKMKKMMEKFQKDRGFKNKMKKMMKGGGMGGMGSGSGGLPI